MKHVAVFLLAAGSLAWIVQAQRSDIVWAPKADELTKYTPPHKPHTKLADVKAAHAGEKSWRQLVVDDDQLHAEWVQSAPGERSLRMMHPDTRSWWIVMDGQIRFYIEGVNEQVVAGKGAIVNVPMQTFFSMETLGDQPALAFEVNIARAKTLYAQSVQPPELPGFHWMKVRMARRPSVYENGNRPIVTFDQLAENVEKRGAPMTQNVVKDDRAVANFIYGYEKKLPPLNPNDKGHYHPESSEFWLIMAGKIRYPIEGQDVVIADAGDVVYVPKFTFHAPRFYGDGPSCRLAMNGFPNIAHLFEAR